MDDRTGTPSVPVMKIVGSRRPGTGLLKAAPFLELIVALRGRKPFIPRGIHRFTSFEESQTWSMRMMARTRNPDPQP
jgi:hypothetical protein